MGAASGSTAARRLVVFRKERAESRAQAKTPVTGGFVALALLVGVLDIVGLAMVLSASSVHDLRVYHSAWYSFIRQLIYVVVGTVVMLIAIRVDYRRWRKLAVPLLAVCLAMLLFVLVPGIGVRVNGSSR